MVIFSSIKDEEELKLTPVCPWIAVARLDCDGTGIHFLEMVMDRLQPDSLDIDYPSANAKRRKVTTEAVRKAGVFGVIVIRSRPFEGSTQSDLEEFLGISGLQGESAGVIPRLKVVLRSE